MYRTIFEGHFPQKAAVDTVPGERWLRLLSLSVCWRRVASVGVGLVPRVSLAELISTPTDTATTPPPPPPLPGGPSVACSTATAALWDAAWAGQEDPSGRAVAGVHDSAYKAT
jgi:hypothetical protein